MDVYDPKQVEKQVQEFWSKGSVPQKIVKPDWKKKKFYLLDGPPYVNGVPHVGHAKTTIFKDVWGRFKFMQGHSVWFQPGFDCGGLPIENKVEQQLKVASKRDIEEKVGVDKFIEECKRFAKGNEPVWLDFYRKIAAWRGWLEPYLTSENYYLESGWWTIKKWFESGLFVQGKRPGFWCPHCETVLAGIEVSESYKNIEDPAVYVKFPLKGRKNEYLLVFTTTPWTLPANVALVVHPDEVYVKAKAGNDIIILAEKLIPEIEKLGHELKVIEKFPGKKLEGLKYEPVLDVPVQKQIAGSPKVHTVLLSIQVMKKRVTSKSVAKGLDEGGDEFGHMVTMDVGTGIVHTAPGHGDVDSKVGRHYNLPEPSPVNEQGHLTQDAGQFAGLFVKKADKPIIEYLQGRGLMFHSGRLTHSYPLCWRCKTPLIYRLSKQWFVKMDLLKERIVKANKKINWLPEFAREQYNNVISEAPDWAVTRQRYWGIPLPVWTCLKCSSLKVIGSAKELKENSISKLPESFDLHKNFVDKVQLKCDCGGKMAREKDIMDVWFDSGIAPWASLGYPFRNKDLFEKLWDVDLVDESQDQVRAWFNTLMICGFATFSKAPYKTVCLNGWTLDEKGEKMSKSLGNVVLAQDAYQRLGADVLRLYICSDVAPWQTQKFSYRQADELKRFISVLVNTHKFISTYAPKYSEQKNLLVEDRWLISRTNSLIKAVTAATEKFEFHLASRDLIDFLLNDLSRWYIKIIRDRLSPSYEGSDKAAAAYAINYAMENFLVLLAPFCPIISENLSLERGQKSSIHLQDWPRPGTLVDDDLEKAMNVVKNAFEAASSLRQDRKSVV